MIAIRALLLTAATLVLASPALAGDYSHWWWSYRYAEAPWHFVCGAFEARHKCNAEFRTVRCRCLMR